MALIGKWSGHEFIVSPALIRGFTNLTISGSSEIDEKESAKEKYAVRKSGKPMEISMTVQLFAATGCDVRGEAVAFVEEAGKGESDYLYVSGKKLVPSRLMLVSAHVDKVVIGANGQWVSAEVKLSMKQCAKADGSAGGSSGSGGGSKKASVKVSANVLSGVVPGAVSGFKGLVGSGLDSLAKTTSTAKQFSAAKKAADRKNSRLFISKAMSTRNTK